MGELAKGDVFVGRYEIRRTVGRGGMNTVWEAFDRKLETAVALKTLSGRASRDGLERFEREAKCLAKVRSKHVIKIFDFGADAGRPYIAMELLRGTDLKGLLRKGKLRTAAAVDLVLAASRGLAACHFQHAITHRDIKPANIFLHKDDDHEEVVKLLDFGISLYPFAAEITGPNAIAGTLQYMSPEQARARGMVDAASDQYSLAVVLYECLTGRRPYDAHDDRDLVARLVTGKIVKPTTVRPDLPLGLEQAVLRAMSLEPERRFENIQEFGKALLPFASSLGQAIFAERLSAPPAAIADMASTSAGRANIATSSSIARTATTPEAQIATIDNRDVVTILASPGAAGGNKSPYGETKELSRAALPSELPPGLAQKTNKISYSAPTTIEKRSGSRNDAPGAGPAPTTPLPAVKAAPVPIRGDEATVPATEAPSSTSEISAAPPSQTAKRIRIPWVPTVTAALALAGGIGLWTSRDSRQPATAGVPARVAPVTAPVLAPAAGPAVKAKTAPGSAGQGISALREGALVAHPRLPDAGGGVVRAGEITEAEGSANGPRTEAAPADRASGSAPAGAAEQAAGGSRESGPKEIREGSEKRKRRRIERTDKGAPILR